MINGDVILFLQGIKVNKKLSPTIIEILTNVVDNSDVRLSTLAIGFAVSCIDITIGFTDIPVLYEIATQLKFSGIVEPTQPTPTFKTNEIQKTYGDLGSGTDINKFLISSIQKETRNSQLGNLKQQYD